MNSGRILTMVVCLGGTTLAGVALAQETQNAETQVALPLPQARLTTPLDPSTASKQSQQTTPPDANKPPAIDAPKPNRLGLTVDFASLPDAPRPQAIAPPENSDSQQSSTASLSGTVIDKNGAALEGAQVALTGPLGSPVRNVHCGSNGQFEFTGLTPDIYKLTVTAPGMSTFTSPEIALHAGELRILPLVSLSVSPVTTTVIVNAGTSEQLSEEQLHIAVQQRIAGIIPNFYSSYDWNAPPMLAKHKFQLSIRFIIDPVSFLTVAGHAGAQQYENVFPSTVAESKDMENDTALHSRITYLPRCWGELFTLQSSIRIHAISTRARELSGRACYMPSRPQSLPGATMGAGNPIIRGYSATFRPQPSRIFTIRRPIAELRWSSSMVWQASAKTQYRISSANSF